MKTSYKLLLICISIPLIVGGLAALLSSGSMQAFAGMNKPPLSPPGWIFPVVWTILYLLMGLASYLIVTSDSDNTTIGKALKIYAFQLIFNFFWTFWFFNLELYWFAFIWLIILWVLVLLTLINFYQIDKNAGYLLVPYLLWCSFALYLNFGIALLNS